MIFINNIAMVVYECEKCYKEFNHKVDYERHINKKNSCIKNGQIKYKSDEDDILKKILQSNQELVMKIERLEENVEQLEQKIIILKRQYKIQNLLSHKNDSIEKKNNIQNILSHREKTNISEYLDINIEKKLDDDNDNILDDLFERNNIAVPKSVKDNVLSFQKGKCANFPGSKIREINGYICILYKNNGDGKILLKTNGECDHIKPREIGGSNDEWNLQYLCQFCHAEKTSNDRKELSFIKKYYRKFKKIENGNDNDNNKLKYKNILLQEYIDTLQKDYDYLIYYHLLST